MENSTSLTLFECLPTELHFNIFDYLSCNDAVYAFSHLNEKLRNSLIQHPYCLQSFELPTSNLTYWRDILPKIESKIRILKITTVDISLSLNFFSNLTSIIIDTLYGSFNGLLKSIFENKQFKTLKILQIKNEYSCGGMNKFGYENGVQRLLQKIFSNGNMLQIFECRSIIQTIPPEMFYALSFNPCIQSLTLKLNSLIDGLYIMQYAPNLKYFNIEVDSLYQQNKEYKWPTIERIKLEKLSLTFNNYINYHNKIDSRQLKSIIKQFSASLTCLSLFFNSFNIDSKDDFILNGVKLKEELLESMIHLKDFHLYVELNEKMNDTNDILSSFQDDFYLDRHWIFGTHSYYFYSLPLQIEQIYDFEYFKSANDQFPKASNERLWFKVKSITLTQSRAIDISLLTFLKLILPKLKSIRIYHKKIKTNQNETNQMNITLDNVTNVYLRNGSIENEKHWLISAIPNLKSLSLANVRLPSSKNELTSILNERIQRLTVTGYTNSAQLTNSILVCFSNLQNLEITFEKSLALTDHIENSEQVMRLLTSLKNLKTLKLTLAFNAILAKFDKDKERNKFIERLTRATNRCSYKMQCTDDWIYFFKQK